MSDYTDHLRDWTQQTLERTEPTEAELAEQEERRRRIRLDESRKWDPSNPKGLTPGKMRQAEYDAWFEAGCPPLGAGATTLPATTEKRAGEATRVEYATRKWVNASFNNLTKAFGQGMSEYTRKLIGPLRADLDQARSVNEAHGRVIDRLSRELETVQRARA